MNVRFGNLSADEIEARAGVIFSDELKALLNSTHQANANNIEHGRWHCFDLPFVMECGGMPLAQKIYDLMKVGSKDWKEPLSICLSQHSTNDHIE
jgi:hypothetical protein